MRYGSQRVKSTRSRGFLLCVAALRVTRRYPQLTRLFKPKVTLPATTDRNPDRLSEGRSAAAFLCGLS